MQIIFDKINLRSLESVGNVSWKNVADVCCCDGEEGQVLKTEWTLTNGPAGGDGEIAGASRLSPSQGLNLPSSQGASILIHPQNITLFQALLLPFNGDALNVNKVQLPCQDRKCAIF